MTDRELFEKALEALEEIRGGYSRNLIAALRERLAQPEQEPFAWVDESAIRWLADRKGKTSAHCTTQLSAARSFEQWMPLYTTPQRREWVGLTDEDKQTAVWTNGTFGAGALWAEAKLREKNT